MHQRFPDTFTPLLTFHLAKLLQPPNRLSPEKEESSRVSKQRTYLRIAVELWLAGVLRNVEDGIPTLASANLEGVESQGDGVAGFMGSTKTRNTNEANKDANTVGGGFVYGVLKELVSPYIGEH